MEMQDLVDTPLKVTECPNPNCDSTDFLAEMGAKVALLDVDEEPGGRIASEIGEGAVFVTCDVTDGGDCQNAVETVKKRWGRIDGLVNCLLEGQALPMCRGG